MSVPQVDGERARVSIPEAFTAFLRGHPCTVVGLASGPTELPLDRWSAEADASDRLVLDNCQGPTLDIGCGPGRMTEQLTRLGLPALGIDVIAEAVQQTRARGCAARRCDVFGPVPSEGRWQTALLADGNVGIGGDPVRLLRRVRALICPGGQVVVDLAPAGTSSGIHTLRIESEQLVSRPFRWAVLGPEAITALAGEAGLVVTRLHEHHGRWFCVLRPRPARSVDTRR